MRKIHKKDRNYFLNKGGSRENSSGGGWVAFSAKKTCRSTASRLSRGSISSVEETKTGGFSQIAAGIGIGISVNNPGSAIMPTSGAPEEHILISAQKANSTRHMQADRYSSSGRGGSGRGGHYKRGQAGRKSAINSRVRTYSGSASSIENGEEADGGGDDSSQDELSLSDY